jgi:hypothetical protein
MGKFEKLKDVGLALLVTIVGFAVRFFIRLQQNYYMNYDSYAYLNVANTGVLRNEFVLINYIAKYLGIYYTDLLLWGITCLTFILFYALCRIYTNKFSSFLASLFFAISPLVFFNNQFGIFDKNVYSLFMIILIMFFMFKTEGKRWINNTILFLLIGLFAFMWQGFWAIALIYLAYLLIESLVLNKIDHTGYLLVIMLSLLYAGQKTLYGLVVNSGRVLTSELAPIYYVGLFSEYLVMILVYIFLLTKLRIEKNDKEKLLKYLPIYIGFLISFFAMVAVFRLNIIFLPFLYLGFAMMLNEFDYKWQWKTLFYLVLVAFVVLTSLNLYNKDPVVNDDMIAAIDYMNTQDTNCIVGLWDKGYIYQYYSDKKVLYKGASGQWKEQLDYMVYGNQTDCSIIYSDNDIKALEWMMKQHRLNSPNTWLIKVLPHTTFGKYYVID